MIVLKEGVSSQEDMQAWFSQLSDPEFPVSRSGLLALLKPQFVSCDLEQKTAVFAFDVKEWELNPEEIGRAHV